MAVKITLSPYEMELLEDAKAYWLAYIEREEKPPSRDRIREKLGCGAQSARNLQLWLTDFYDSTPEEKEATVSQTMSDNNNTWEINLKKTRISSLEELLEKFKIDKSIWRVDSFTVNTWEVGMKPVATTEYVRGKRGTIEPRFVRTKEEPIIVPLNQVKAVLKRKVDVQAVKQEIADLKKQAKEEIRPLVALRPTGAAPNKSGLLLEVAIFDIHFGKQSWSQETLGRPYDIKITEAMFFRALNKIIERSAGLKYEKVLFIVGNDALHSNDLESRTASGTVVDSDGRVQKAFTVARRAMVEAIEMLRKIAPVEVLVVPGNHDRFSAWALGDSLESYFHTHTDVNIDNEPSLRKYFEWGNVGLMFTHGDEGKRQDFPLLLATEKREMFGRTKYNEIHTGHNHTTKNEEFHGIRVRILSSLSTPDAWHSQKGYVGSLRTAEAFVWSKEEGLIASYTYTDDAHPAIISKREIVNDSGKQKS